jgi:hypothetical protein
MAALLLLLLTAAWVEDGLLRRFVDPGLRRRALAGRAGYALAGIVLLACAFELAAPLPWPLARTALHAFALVLVGFALAADDAGPPHPSITLHRLREAAPPIDALALAMLATWLLVPAARWLQGAMLLVAWTGIAVFVRLIGPPLDARLAAVIGSRRRLHWARLSCAVLLALALLGARAWLP